MPNDGNNNQNNPQEVNNNPQPQEVNQAPQQPAQNKVDLQKHLDAANNLLHQEEQVLDMLKGQQNDLSMYDQSQKELLENRRKELDVYDFSKREPYVQDYRKNVPNDLDSFKKIKDPKEERDMRFLINNAIYDEKKEHDKKTTMDLRKKLEVQALEEYEGYEGILNDIANQLVKEGLDRLPKKDREWFEKSRKSVTAADMNAGGYFPQYDGAKKEYTEKQKAYNDAIGFYQNNVRKSQEEEYEFYQTLVARRLVMKQAIKSYGMVGDGVVDTFKALGKQRANTKNPDEYNKSSEKITYNLKDSVKQGNAMLSNLGYTKPEEVKHILEDYYALEQKINDYSKRITDQINQDKATPGKDPDSIAIKQTAEAREKWIKANQYTRVNTYFDPKGNLKKGHEDIKTLSDAYDPKKDQIAERDRLFKEQYAAKFRYYQTFKSRQLLQKDAINTALQNKNKEVNEHNKREKIREEKNTKWQSQEDCDQRFIEDVEKRAGAATKQRRKMMVGSMLAGFAANLTSTVGDKITQAGNIVAEGIIKGERVQVENELNELKSKQNEQRKAALAAMNLAGKDREEAKELFLQDNQKSEDQSRYKLLDGRAHIRKGNNAANRYLELDKQITAKQKQLKEVTKKEGERLDEFQKNLTESIYKNNDKKMEQNQLAQQENAMTDLATQLINAQKNTNAAGDNSIDPETIGDLMNAKTEVRKKELTKQQEEILKSNADLKQQMDLMEEYSNTLKKYLTPTNLGKVDTIVSIAETLYSAYSTASKFIEGKLKKDDEKEENKEEDKKDKDEAEKADEKNGDEKEDEASEEFELNIIESIKELKEKAKSISDSMSGEGEKENEETIIKNVTDLTVEAGMIVQQVSKKIQEMNESMTSSMEEALAREEAEKGFLEDAKKHAGSPVESARKELDEQLKLHKNVMDADIKINELAIKKQEQRVEEARNMQTKLLADMNLLERHEAEEARKRKEEEIRALEKEKQEMQVPETEEIRKAREEYEQAKQHRDECKLTTEDARKNYNFNRQTHEGLLADMYVKNLQLDFLRNEFSEKQKQARELQDDTNLKTQQDKHKALLKQKQEEADAAKSAIRSTAVKSFFVDIANSAAQYSKGFMDQLTIGFSETVIKGKVKQMEDELSEKEDAFRLKGETALAKDRSRMQHFKEAQRLGKDDEKYKSEMEESAIAGRQAVDLQKDRLKIREEISDMQRDLAKAKVDEKNKLEELHEELKKAYGIDPDAAQNIEIKTNVNELKRKAALEQYNQAVASGKDVIDIITSPMYTETDTEQREVIKEQVKNLKLEEDVEKKAKKLESYSNTLKGLFTPKNMSRVDTVISAAETLYGLYGSVKGMISGDGGDEDEDEKEEEKSIAEKVKDIKEKASSVRRGMMGEGEKNDDEPQIVQNLLDITQSMRTITDVVTKKIDTLAKQYNADLETQREIKMNADKEIAAYKEVFKDKNITLPEAVKAVSKNAMEKMEYQQQSFQINDKAIRDNEPIMKELEEELKKQEDVLKNADEKATDAKKKLDETIEKEKKRIEEEIKRQQEKLKQEQEELRKMAMDEEQRKEEQRRQEEQRREEQRRLAEEREREADRLRTLHEKNDPKMEQLQDLLDNLTDTKNGYAGHDNTTEYGKVIDQLQKFTGDTDKNIDFSKENIKDLKDALTGYLNHVGMDTAWHRNGNVRKENVLAALNIIDPETAKIFEQQANNVRRKSKQLDLNTLMEKESIKRPDEKRRNRQPSAQSAQNVKKEEKLPDLNSQIVSRK